MYVYLQLCFLLTDLLIGATSNDLILRLHCHRKPSQSGTVLKIALCWPLTGSIYTAMFNAVRVLSIFDLKGGMSGSASRDIRMLLVILWRLIYRSLLLSAKETYMKAQKHMECSYTVVILLLRVLGTETHWFSTWHGTVAAWIWLDIVYTGR